MADIHSIWLMAAAPHEAQLQEIVDDLARRFGAPVFRPHLTLVQDMACPLAELSPAAAETAAGIRSFAANVEEIGVSEAYFRSFYARFAVEGAMRKLKERAGERLLSEDIGGFMPHVSLAYGVEESAAKRAALRRMTARLVGRPIRFDRLCVVRSGKGVPIEEWEIRSTALLR